MMNPDTLSSAPLRRLPGASPSVRRQDGARATLWLGGAHLVQELVRGYTVEVQRFALADLQAIQCRRTARGLVYNFVLLVLLVPMGLRLTTILDERGPILTGHLVFWIAFGFLVVSLLVNVVRGPTCRTTLTTALGPQPLPSLSRVRATRRALLLIANGVATVQGALRPDEAAGALDLARTQTPAGPAPAAATFQAYRY